MRRRSYFWEQEHNSLREQDYMQNALSCLAIVGGHQRLIKTILISSARDQHTDKIQ